MAPTKIHQSLTITLPTLQYTDETAVLHVCQFTYGAAFEPQLADLNRIFANLTPKGVDPSDQLPFWDKMRFIFHGHLQLVIPDGGAFRIRLGGSRRPHDLACGSSAGLDIVLMNGVHVQFGQIGDERDEYPTMRLLCGEVAVAVPEEEPNSIDEVDPRLGEVLARFAGGIKLNIGFEFETVATGTHADVVLQLPSGHENTVYS